MKEKNKRKPSLFALVFFGVILFEMFGEFLVAMTGGFNVILPTLFGIGIIGTLVTFYVLKNINQNKTFKMPFQREKTTQKELNYTFINCPSCNIENHSTNYMCTHCGETLREELV